jgi:hypothetical protein
MVSLLTSYIDRHRWDGFLARSYIDRNCDAFYVIKLYIGRHLDCVFTMQIHHPSNYAHASNYSYTGMVWGNFSAKRGSCSETQAVECWLSHAVCHADMTSFPHGTILSSISCCCTLTAKRAPIPRFPAYCLS